jgi:hypothetical protein
MRFLLLNVSVDLARGCNSRPSSFVLEESCVSSLMRASQIEPLNWDFCVCG